MNLDNAVIIILITSSLVGCAQREFGEKPAIITGDVGGQKVREAKVSGTIIDLGKGVVDYGHCWALENYPTVSDNLSRFGASTERATFSSDMKDLLPGTTYYVRSYIISGNDVVYGEPKGFSTLTGTVTVKNTFISKNSYFGLLSGGTVTGNGGDSIISRGVCWSKYIRLPTIDKDPFFKMGKGLGDYSDTVTTTKLDRRYFLRTFAFNSVDTAYGETLEIRTPASSNFIISFNVSDITANSALSGGYIKNIHEEDILARGVCWGKTSEPTIDDSITQDGISIGSYLSFVENLQPSSTYYLRSYVITPKRVIYGSVIQFVTKEA